MFKGYNEKAKQHLYDAAIEMQDKELCKAIGKKLIPKNDAEFNLILDDNIPSKYIDDIQSDLRRRLCDLYSVLQRVFKDINEDIYIQLTNEYRDSLLRFLTLIPNSVLLTIDYMVTLGNEIMSNTQLRKSIDILTDIFNSTKPKYIKDINFKSSSFNTKSYLIKLIVNDSISQSLASTIISTLDTLCEACDYIINIYGVVNFMNKIEVKNEFDDL